MPHRLYSRCYAIALCVANISRWSVTMLQSSSFQRVCPRTFAFDQPHSTCISYGTTNTGRSDLNRRRQIHVDHTEPSYRKSCSWAGNSCLC